jgi:AGZA family xanthine/uracil permease-like MFS transporter
MPWFVRGDIDGFFGLALDNFVQLLLIDALCLNVLQFPAALLYGRVLPGVAVSLLVGNFYYAWQARQLSLKTGRRDICALPYGINTVSLFGHVFLIMLPAKIAASAAGHPHPEIVAWHAGLVACLGSGLIECAGAFVAERIRKATPRAALLSTLAGIALTFIALGFLFRTFAHPIVGLTTLSVVMLIYFGRVKFRGGIPGGLVAVALGTFLAWQTGLVDRAHPPAVTHSFFYPVPVLGDLIEALRGDYARTYLSVIIPMGLFNMIGSLQNIESAEAAGDSYPTRPSLMVNGIGSIAAALFGSCFPTTIYIGHPGWKAIGSRAGYSILNGIGMTIICLTGTLAYIAWAVPIDAGMAIVIWIGMVITAQAFQAVPPKHAPAVVVGLLPGIAAWGALLAKNTLRAAGWGAPGGPSFQDQSSALMEQFVKLSDTHIHGAFALEQGFIFTAMLLSAVTVFIIERQFIRASVWCGIAALFSLLGLMHSYQWTPGDTVLSHNAAVHWAIGYAIMGLVLLLARWVTVEGEDAH